MLWDFPCCNFQVVVICPVPGRVCLLPVVILLPHDRCLEVLEWGTFLLPRYVCFMFIFNSTGQNFCEVWQMNCLSIYLSVIFCCNLIFLQRPHYGPSIYVQLWTKWDGAKPFWKYFTWCVFLDLSHCTIIFYFMTLTEFRPTINFHYLIVHFCVACKA